MDDKNDEDEVIAGSPSMDDRIVRARRGDGEALNQLVAELRPILLRYAERATPLRMRKRIEPADLVQTALEELHVDFATFTGLTFAELVAFARNILINNSRDEIKRQEAQKRDIGAETSMESTVDDTGARRRKRWELLAHQQTSATQRLARTERAARVRAAMERLPERQRDAITLWLSGYTGREIAARMQTTELAVAGLIRRGLVALRELLAAGTGKDSLS